MPEYFSRPEVGIGLDVDQLGRDPERGARSAHAALQRVADVELAPDAPEVPAGLLELDRRGPGDHGERPDPGEVGDHLLHQAVGEVRVVGIGAQVGERQHDDGLLRRGRGSLRGLQRRQELQHRPKPVRRDLGQRPLDGPSHRPRHAGAERGERRHRVEQLARQHRGDAGPGEGRLTRQQLVEDAGEAVLVGPGVDLAFAFGLLGTHVGGGPHAQPGPGQPVAGRDAHGPRDAEVRDQGVALREQDVLRLHVAMNQPFPVGVVERFAGLPHQAERLRLRGAGPRG